MYAWRFNIYSANQRRDWEEKHSTERDSTSLLKKLNQSISPSMWQTPNTISFSRNGPGRDHSQIHVLNNLPVDSILMKAAFCGVPLPPNSLCLSELLWMNTGSCYHFFKSQSRLGRTKKSWAGLLHEWIIFSGLAMGFLVNTSSEDHHPWLFGICKQ